MNQSPVIVHREQPADPPYGMTGVKRQHLQVMQVIVGVFFALITYTLLKVMVDPEPTTFMLRMVGIGGLLVVSSALFGKAWLALRNLEISLLAILVTEEELLVPVSWSQRVLNSEAGVVSHALISRFEVGPTTVEGDSGRRFARVRLVLLDGRRYDLGWRLVDELDKVIAHVRDRAPGVDARAASS